MMRWLKYVVLLGIIGCNSAWGQPYSSGQGYACQTTSVTSATVPVNVLPAKRMSSFVIHVRSGAAVSALLLPYIGALPGAAPANVMEVAAGTSFSDNTLSEVPTSRFAMGNPWGAVLASGVTAITLDACWR
jgi:hypothetical protein